MKMTSFCLFFVFSIALTNPLFAAPAKNASNNPGKPSTNSITENINGPTVQTASDGTKIISNPDGSKVQIYTDGSLLVINSDGSTIQKNADGSEVDSKI